VVGSVPLVPDDQVHEGGDGGDVEHRQNDFQNFGSAQLVHGRKKNGTFGCVGHVGIFKGVLLLP
jgi:hypothetical protein